MKKDILINIAMLTIAYYLGTFNLISFNKISTPLMNVENKTDCNSSILSESAECLNDELKTFFKYNLSQVGKDINLTELKESGGVCHNYAQWFKDNLINLGYNSKIIIIESNDISHEITIAWDKNLSNGEYCLADQTSIFCNKLSEINMTLYKELINEN